MAINMALLAELPWVGGDGRWLSTIPKPETERDSAFGLRASDFKVLGLEFRISKLTTEGLRRSQISRGLNRAARLPTGSWASGYRKGGTSGHKGDGRSIGICPAPGLG